MNINETMRELAEYSRLADEIGATIENLKDNIKQYMQDNNIDTVTGTEHKATYKTVTGSRIDTTAIKKDLPEIAAKYTKTTATRRFTFI